MIKFRTRRRNTPIATLIKNYLDKKSGKVADSRREIQQRFDHLDWKDQKKLIMAFLDSGKTDRQWIYTKLFLNWDKSFESKVREVWETYHEPQCAWSVIRFFPVAYVKENIESFTGHRDYYFVCLRLAEDPTFVIDRSKLRTIDYLSVLYHSGRGLTDRRALDIMFEIIHEACVRELDLNDIEPFGYTKQVVSPENFRHISQARYYLWELKCEKAAMAFDQWNQKVKNTIATSPEYMALVSSHGDTYSIREQALSIIRKYAYEALDDKFKSPSDHEVNEPDSQTVDDTDFLEELERNNPAFKYLMETFELEIDDKIPF